MNHDGDIISTSIAAFNGTGTRVVATSIFYAMPVRRKQFDGSNVAKRKAEMAKIQDIVYAYAIAMPAVF